MGIHALQCRAVWGLGLVERANGSTTKLLLTNLTAVDNAALVQETAVNDAALVQVVIQRNTPASLESPQTMRWH